VSTFTHVKLWGRVQCSRDGRRWVQFLSPCRALRRSMQIFASSCVKLKALTITHRQTDGRTDRQTHALYSDYSSSLVHINDTSGLLQSVAFCMGVGERSTTPLAGDRWHQQAPANIGQSTSRRYSCQHDDTIRYDRRFALTSWQTSCHFNLTRKLKKTTNVLDGTERSKKKIFIKKQTAMGEIRGMR